MPPIRSIDISAASLFSPVVTAVPMAFSAMALSFGIVMAEYLNDRYSIHCYSQYLKTK